MAKDYTNLQALATRVIAKYGQAVDLLKESRTPANAAAPWEGTATAETRVEDVFAVFVPLYGETAVIEALASVTGALVRTSNSFLIAAVAGQDVTTFQKVVQGTTIWRITRVNTNAPGDTVLLYQVEVDG